MSALAIPTLRCYSAFVTREYRIEFSPEAIDHLDDLPARSRRIVIDAVEEHLRHEPTVETRNRKPLRPNPVAPWELRVGNIRVFYDPTSPPGENQVKVLAVGVKAHGELRVGGARIRL